MKNNIKLSVICITYNHAKFIRQTIESFLLQETDFEFEVLIHDDASTDGTQEIIKEYQTKYPEIVKPIFQKENKFSRGIRGIMIKYLIPKARGKYLAICEGDDYWTDPKKLQLQVDLLDKYPDYSFCFHRAEVIYDDEKTEGYIYPNVEDLSWYSLSELLRLNYIPTNSVVCRNLDYSNFPDKVMPLDWFFHLYNASKGKFKIIDKVMSVYRKHQGGIWWNYDVERHKLWEKHGLEQVNMQTELLKIYKNNEKLKHIIHNNIIELFKDFSEMEEKEKSDLLEHALVTENIKVETLLKEALIILRSNDGKITELWKVVDSVKSDNIGLKDEVLKIEKDLVRVTEALDELSNYKFVKVARKVKAALRKISRVV